MTSAKQKRAQATFVQRAARQSTSEEEGTSSYNTPSSVLMPIRTFFGGTIDLDPCSNATSIVKAKKAWTIEDDGLARSWKGYQHTFMNPVYGAKMRKWLHKARSESLLHGIEVIGLIPGRTEQRYFQALVFPPAAGAVCFWRNRVVYGQGGKFKTPAMFPSLLPYWGHDIRRFYDHFSPYGAVWTR